MEPPASPLAPKREGVPPLTYGAALPPALAITGRTAAAAAHRAHGRKRRLKETLRALGVLRANLAAVCRAAAGAAATDSHWPGAEAGEQARAAFLLQAVCGVHTEEDPEGDDDAFRFLRRVRAFRLARLTAAEGPSYGPTQGSERTSDQHIRPAHRTHQRTSAAAASAARAGVLARGVEDVSDAFAAFELLLEVLGLQQCREEEAGGERGGRRRRVQPPALPLPAATARLYVASTLHCIAAAAAAMCPTPTSQVPTCQAADGQLPSETARVLLDGFVLAADAAAAAAALRDRGMGEGGAFSANPTSNVDASPSSVAGVEAHLALVQFAVERMAVCDAALAVPLLVACARRIHQHATGYTVGTQPAPAWSAAAAETATGAVDRPRWLRPMCVELVDTSDTLESLGFVFVTAEGILRRLSGGGGGTDTDGSNSNKKKMKTKKRTTDGSEIDGSALAVVGGLVAATSEILRLLCSGGAQAKGRVDLSLNSGSGGSGHPLVNGRQLSVNQPIGGGGGGTGPGGGPGRGAALLSLRVARLGAMTRVALDSTPTALP